MQVTIDALEGYLAQLYRGRVGGQSLFIKMVEEVGEVADVLNRRRGSKPSESDDLAAELGNELADVIHYAVAIAAVNGLDLNDILLEKDKRASVKYHHQIDLETFILKNSRQ